MKHLTITVLLVVVAVTTIVGISKSKTPATAAASLPLPAEQPPKFLVNGGEYIFVPIPNAAVTFANPVRTRDIAYYPWVFVEHITDAPPRRECSEPCVWVNMNQITVVKVQRGG